MFSFISYVSSFFHTWQSPFSNFKKSLLHILFHFLFSQIVFHKSQLFKHRTDAFVCCLSTLSLAPQLNLISSCLKGICIDGAQILPASLCTNANATSRFSESVLLTLSVRRNQKHNFASKIVLLCQGASRRVVVEPVRN